MEQKSNWKSRKLWFSFIFGTAWFVCSQVLKFQGKISDLYWAISSLGACTNYGWIVVLIKRIAKDKGLINGNT